MPDRPHILILMTDQQRADSMGCTGAAPLQTPNMDRLAAEGVRFANAVTSCPLCMPARASFVSGLYCHSHGMWANRGRLPAGDETFFQHLQRAGYHTAYVGKSHFYEHLRGEHLRDYEPYMRARGIDTLHETTGPWATTITRSYMTDRWEKLGLYKAFRDDYARRRKNPTASWPSPLPAEEFLDSYIGREAVSFVDGYDGAAPVCLFAGFGGPHEPFDAPGQYATMYDPADCPPAIAPEPIPDGLAPAARGYIHRRDSYLKGADAIDPAAAAATRANYYGKIRLIDEWFGRVLDAFDRRGWLDETLVVHWSDHGEMCGDHGLYHKMCFYESSVRVPLTIRWPGELPAGQVRPHLAGTVDVFDTLLSAAGCEPSARSQGMNLLDACRDESAPLREAAFSEVALPVDGRSLRTTMVRTDRYKYAVTESAEPIMLFDLAEDPLEQRNLAADPAAADIRAALDHRIQRWLLETQVSM